MTLPPHKSIAIPFAVAMLGIAFFATMDAVMKGLTLEIGAYNAVFWRVVIGIPIGALLYAGSRPQRPTRSALRVHAIRGVISAAMAVIFFWGLARLPMAEAIAMTFIAPIIALYLAALLLGETIGRNAIVASVLGFGGVLLIVSSRIGQSGAGDWPGIAALLISALLYASNIILMRQQALVASPQEITFSQNLIVAMVLIVFAPFFAHAPAVGHIPALLLAAILASASLILLAWAYRRAEAQHLAPVEYTALIWSALFGYLIFDEQVGASTILGAALIVAGCFIAARSGRAPSPVEAAL
jgi:S-adenosylmethionine uptake transporter